MWLKDYKLVDEARRLGYKVVSVEGLDSGEASLDPNVFSKVVVVSDSISNLKSALGGLKGPKTVVSVVPLNVEVARWVAHDRRVDSIVMTSRNQVLFDKKQASVMKYYDKPLEVPFTEIRGANESSLAGFVKRLKLMISRKVPIIISSGASGILEYHHPLVVLSFIVKLLDVDYEAAKAMLSTNPYKVLTRTAI
ncbi:RNase P subunit p30 family protein [Thermogladius sp. KZ2Tp1]|uniref:RNase P subunit p30 family protein n=1 Tax=Thermogladius sp. KZ2Tp1 TaxID=3136289 RepID=UPI003DA9834A